MNPESANSEYDQLAFKIMNVTVDLLSVLVYLWRDRHIFHSPFLFNIWHKLLKERIKDVLNPTKKEDVLISDNPATQKTTIFEVQVKALQNVRTPGMYQSEL